MRKKKIYYLLAICSLLLSACSGNSKPAVAPTSIPALSPTGELGAQPTDTPTLSPAVEPTDNPTDTPVLSPTGEPGAQPTDTPTASPVPSPTDDFASEEQSLQDKLYACLMNTMTGMEAAVELDISGMVPVYGLENDIKNIYYRILAEHPELKYAYDLKVSVSGNTASCTFLYMPYKTGEYDAGLPAGSHTVNSLHDAKIMAQGMNNGTEELSIAITDASLEVEDIQRALAQAGYGWISYTLSQDGTKILATAPVDMTLSDCAQAINDSFALCGTILAEITTEAMDDFEKAEAIYSYITNHVAYDFRFYSGKNDMPYESTVAMGALRDNLAVCGGYAHAFEMLLDMAGIENYTVSGVSSGEYHAWNYVVLDGEGYYCDPTADRGGMAAHFMKTADELAALGQYSWSEDFYPKLVSHSLSQSR